MKKRNFNTPEYKTWRKAVLKRDKRTCQMPGCKSKRRLQVHHIMTWAHAPRLRFEVSNGITLCRKCHDSIRKRERSYANLFTKIVQSNENNS